MNKFLKRLPLPLKLLLLILLPLALIIYLTIKIYNEKSDKAELLHGYLNRINQSAIVSDLITNLQAERRASYAFALKRDSSYKPEIDSYRRATDEAIRNLENLKVTTLINFKGYTFLDSLQSARRKIDNGWVADLVMHYYTTSIFRLNTLHLVSAGNNKYLNPVFDALTVEKILNEMVSYLGIIRANFYNALYTKKNNIAMLYGLMGTYDVFKSYERELLIKASPEMAARYTEIRNKTEVKPTLDYLEHTFKKFSFDTIYAAEDWWKMSERATFRLRDYKNELLNSARLKMDAVYASEKQSRNELIILLIIALVIVFSWMIYTSRIISTMLNDLGRAAQKIAAGHTNVPIPEYSKDVLGNLSASIRNIDEKNITLAKTADAIGKGNFNVPVEPRSEKDMLGNAILQMRNNLREFTMEIEKTHENFRLVADAAPVMIWMSGTNKLCNFFNKGWLNFTGRSLADELGDGWIEDIHPDDLDRCVQTYSSSFDQRCDFYMEYRMRRKDGEYRWIGDSGIPRYSPDGAFDGYIGACTEIHEMKLYEQRKDDFIIMASHELNTPVTSIKGHVQLLQSIYEGDDKKISDSKVIVRPSLQSISKQVSKLTWLISELLDLSKIETGKFELYKTKFDPAALVEEAIQEVKHLAPGHTFTMRNGFTGVLYADKERIAQVLLNLFTNAIKYSPGANHIEISLQGNHEHISVSIKDEGIGIDKKDQQKIFERFYRVEGKSEQTYPGFGIGLFIASEIIRRHQGTLGVESEKGKGAVFTFTLPLIKNDGNKLLTDTESVLADN